MSDHLRNRGEAAARYPALSQFLACYFHQDWPVFYDSPEAAIDTAIRESSVERRQQVQRELADLLHRIGDDTRLRSILSDGFGLNLGFKRPAAARAFGEQVERKLLATAGNPAP